VCELFIWQYLTLGYVYPTYPHRVQMSRRIASQVHQQVSRLMRGNFIQNEPVWYRAVLDNPPLSLPAKAPPPRTAYDQKAPSSAARLRPHSTRPLPIYYLEDEIRRQFFLDHPFETFRPTSLVENERIDEPHPIAKKDWVRLRQRGRNPLPEECVSITIS
jgi:small subunit ribosomal protein S23